MAIKKLNPHSLVEGMEAYMKVMYWFFSFPNKGISLNDLSKAVSISKTTANRVVSQLAAEKFLLIEKIGKLWRITSNQDHSYCLTRKIPYNLGLIYESGILDDIPNHVENPRAIILFGSYRNGDDTEDSDIDIAVEVISNEDLRIVPMRKMKMFGYREDVQVNLHVFSRNHIDLNLFANIANGIVLDGFLEVRP
ncbi:MAG: nucleotidyltransferase domain-containing protein [Nanoarchaeota archaeon]|nr:nucleotidyltransferase domain-containing protein [Nanoarchaeota archaeon]